MLKSCRYCGRVHDSRVICSEKQKAMRKYPKETQAAHIRSLSRWQKIREYVKRRDNGVCQLCLRNYTADNTGSGRRPYEDKDLSVHHIIKLEDDIDKAFDEDNLITLCRTHHEMADAGQISQGILQRIAKENGERYQK